MNQIKSPFKLLDAYTYEDRDYFFGREEEVEQLYKTVFRTRQVLVYGPSGTGKSSLIQCGLASKFQPCDWFSIYIRRNNDLNESLQEALWKTEPEIDKSSITASIEYVYKFFLRPVYLIFDQFEELFILGSKQEQQTFKNTLKAIAKENLPCCVILVMREEYLGLLYEFEQELPALASFFNRLRVEPMNRDKAFRVVKNSLTYPAFNIRLEAPDANAERIIDKFSGKKSGIQLPYLQVYLDMLWQEDIERTYPKDAPPPQAPASVNGGKWYPPIELTTSEIESFEDMEDVLAKFLKQQQNNIQEALGKQAPENAVRQVLDVFVTEQGTKRPVVFSSDEFKNYCLDDPEASELYRYLPAETITDCIRGLLRSRILHVSENTLELSHDSLAAIIDNDRKPEQRHFNEIKRRLVNYHEDFTDRQIFPDAKLYSGCAVAVEPFKFRLDEHLLGFLEDWKTHLDAEEIERLARQEAELTKERSLREAAEVEKLKAQQAESAAMEERKKAVDAYAETRKALRKARTYSWINFGAFIMLVIAMVWGWVTYQDNIVEDAEKEMQSGNFEAAIGLTDKILPLFSMEGKRDTLVRLCHQLLAIDKQVKQADSLYFVENYHAALPIFKQAAVQFEQLKNRPDAQGKLPKILASDEQVQRTEKMLAQTYELYLDKVEKFCEAGICEQAKPYIDKALTNLKPDDPRMLKWKKNCTCLE